MMKDEKNTLTPNELSQDEWWLVLFSFITDLPEEEWNSFVHDLIYKNRFSSSHKVVDVIRNFSEECTDTIKQGQELYRARIYHKDPLKDFLSDVFKNTKEKKTSDNPENISKYYNMQLAAIMMALEREMPRGKMVVDMYNKWKRKRFKGYNSSESGAPPAEKATIGRLNPEKVRYLYLSEDPCTAAYEVRPTIGQNVSIATFKTTTDIVIYDFARDFKPQEVDSLEHDYSLFSIIQQRFSEPNTGDNFMYLPTQYLGEIIKQMGFDGIRFKSSLKRGGINLVLFDDKRCKAVRSDMVKVNDIEVRFDTPEIYQLEKIFDRH